RFRRPTLFGPLLRWELVRLARRGQTTRARILHLYTLLLAVVGLAFVWSVKTSPDNPSRLLHGGNSMSLAQSAQFAESLALMLLAVQMAIVVSVAPTYAVLAIAEEKDRYTLPLLLTSALSDREIVWGKAAARILSLLATLAAGVPVLMITLLFGGVDF